MTAKQSPPALLQIKIERHALPRRALGRADIARRGVEDVLPRTPGLPMRHGIERHRLGEARIDIAAAAPAAEALFALAAPPQRESIAVALLLARLLGREPRRIVQLRRDRWRCRFGHRGLPQSSFPGRSAARSGALLNRDRHKLRTRHFVALAITHVFPFSR